MPSPQPWYFTRKDIAMLPPGRAWWSVINRSCHISLMNRSGPIGKWSYLNWQPKKLWADAWSEKPESVPKAASFILEKLRAMVKSLSCIQSGYPTTYAHTFLNLVWVITGSKRSMLTWHNSEKFLKLSSWSVLLCWGDAYRPRVFCNLAAGRLPIHVLPDGLCTLLSHSIPLHRRTVSTF